MSFDNTSLQMHPLLIDELTIEIMPAAENTMVALTHRGGAVAAHTAVVAPRHVSG